MENVDVRVGARVEVTSEVVHGDGRKVYFIEVPGEITSVGEYVEVRTDDGEVVKVKIDGIELK